MLRRVEAENEEKARLGTGKTYDRSIPMKWAAGYERLVRLYRDATSLARDHACAESSVFNWHRLARDSSLLQHVSCAGCWRYGLL